MYKIKKGKMEKGITLVALIITIIILLILAGISISMLTAKNGIIKQTGNAKEQTDIASAKEEIHLQLLESLDIYGNYNSDTALSNINNNLKNATANKSTSTGNILGEYKGFLFLINTNGELKERYEIPDTLKVGDEVSYTAAQSSYEWKGKYSGEGDDGNKIISNTEGYQIGNWQVLNINEDGIVDLIANSQTEGTVSLGGAQGYNNGVKLLNDVCGKLYGNLEKGITARSINISDIEEKVVPSYLEMMKKNGVMYENEYLSGAYGYFPKIYSIERNNVINEKITKSGLSKNEQNYFIEPTNEEIADIESNMLEWLKVGSNHSKSINPFNSYYFTNVRVSIEETSFAKLNDNSIQTYYSLFISENTNYWIASRSIQCVNAYCSYKIRCISNNEIVGASMYNSINQGHLSNYALKPIISVKATDISFNNIINKWEIDV